jgi:hypothetical protein
MKHRTDYFHFPEQQTTIVIQHRKVMSHFPHHISNTIHGPKLIKYLSEKEKWPSSVFRSITWDSFNIAFHKRQFFTTKKCSAFGVQTYAINMTDAKSKNVDFVATKMKTGATFSHVKAQAQ